ncbi:MAG: (2Fe-2S)-binding protein [Litorimonas sp.]
MAITLKINGKNETVNAADGTPLLWVLRDHLGMTGTKFGCGVAQCGACTVHVDGDPIRSCITAHEDVEGLEVTTIEAANGKVADAIRGAWEELAVPQCGYCQAGQIMSAINLLETNKSPTDDDIDNAMSGNICRCATYVRIRAAIKDAAKTL